MFNHSAASLNQETEARWRLVETAWDLNLNKSLIHVDYYVVSQELFAYSLMIENTVATKNRLLRADHNMISQ